MPRTPERDPIEHPPRIVKPRARTYKRLPVMVIHGDDTLTEDGEIGTVQQLVDQLTEMPPTLFAKVGAADLLAELTDHFKPLYPAAWQARISELERTICAPNGIRVAARVSVAVHYFGWKGGNYHKLIDPITMYGHRLDAIWPGDEPAIARLLHWTVALRNFCDQNDLEVRPTTGSISAQFLTHKRFYPNARRKVPTCINERVREHQPGNHYLLTVTATSEREFTAWYLDQSRAHHYHARNVRLPDANFLYAFGRFTDLAEIAFDRTIPGFYGLYCLDLGLPRWLRSFHWIRTPGTHFVYSNEIQHLVDTGYQIKGVRAAWGSTHLDTGLGRYAEWCEEQLDNHGEPKWLKPLLLSTYGVLATRPRQAEAIFLLASAGEDVTVPTGKHTIDGKLTRRAHKLEPGIANVLHRGMIEAATRSESIGLAQYLQAHGFTVLSIYADAVIVRVDDDKPLPALFEPWRLKRELTHLQFINQQAFVSDSMTKLPGVTREILNYRQARPGHAPQIPPYINHLTGEKRPSGKRIAIQ